MRECWFLPRLGYGFCIFVLIGETGNLSEVLICIGHFSYISDICISFFLHFPGRSSFFLDVGPRDLKGKIVTRIPPIWSKILPLENCSPRPNGSWSVPIAKVCSEHARGLLVYPCMNSWQWVPGELLSSWVLWWREGLPPGLQLATRGTFLSPLSLFT